MAMTPFGISAHLIVKGKERERERKRRKKRERAAVGTNERTLLPREQERKEGKWKEEERDIGNDVDVDNSLALVYNNSNSLGGLLRQQLRRGGQRPLRCTVPACVSLPPDLLAAFQHFLRRRRLVRGGGGGGGGDVDAAALDERVTSLRGGAFPGKSCDALIAREREWGMK